MSHKFRTESMLATIYSEQGLKNLFMLNSQTHDNCFLHKYMYQYTYNTTDEPIVLLRAADNVIIPVTNYKIEMAGIC